MWDLNLEKTFISRHTFHQPWYTCSIALPVRRNPQHKSLLTVVSSTSASGRESPETFERPWENLWPTCERLYATNTSHRKQEIFLYEYPLHWVTLLTKKKHKRTLLFGSITLKQGRHFDYWNQPPKMRVCYLDWTVLLPSDIHRKDYVHYSCFTSNCDLFTDSPSYRDVFFRKVGNIRHCMT
jgi:hypothetical protein